MSETLHDQAVARLRKKRELAGHILVYCLVNGFLIVIWATTSHGFFWPMFPLAGWGIGLVMNVWDVWRGRDFTEEQIAHEMTRLQKR